MVRFFKKNKEQRQPDPDRQVHRTFQIGAILVVLYILQSLYFGDSVADRAIDEDEETMTDDEINAKVKEAFQKMSESPEYKKIKDFIAYMESNADKKSGNILNTDDGIIIYVPNKLIEAAHNNLEIENEAVKFKLSSEKKQLPAK